MVAEDQALEMAGEDGIEKQWRRSGASANRYRPIFIRKP